MDDFEIAGRLNHDGLFTPEGKSFTYASVRWIRYKHGHPSHYRADSGLAPVGNVRR